MIHTVIDNSENFALSPEWYESLPDKTKDYLFSRAMSFATSIEYHYLSRPEDVAPYLADWGSSLVVSF